MVQNYRSLIHQNYFKVIENHYFKAEEKCISLSVNYKKHLQIFTKDIIQLEAYKNYTLFHFNNGNTHLASKTMKEYLTFLDGNFVRIHKKFVINLRFLVQFDLKEEMCVVLKDGKKRSVSRRRKREFLEKTENIFGKMDLF